ncbi:MAG: 23S rRNA (adenine(2503)-C(2))-methyltransferase RlmN [Myxococcota bacterium]|jgi:23S rRNA (adenine2503-C2)-methyltransferase|nr:23S rRNA (adenine(2503)-C(2))-methyltransferase RlmN [Myxococcota bacterium]
MSEQPNDSIRSLSGTDLSTAAIPKECREDACPSLTFDCLLPKERIAALAMTRAEIERFFVEQLEEPAFRARQLFRWLHFRLARSAQEMTELSKPLRARLDSIFELEACRLAEERVAEDGTIKLAFALHDDAVVESVIIPTPERVTLCISSQVGCAMGCLFCRTARMGLGRHLHAGEIVEQVARARLRWAQTSEGARINNIVFMGMGEPLHNVDAVIKAIEILIDPLGMDWSRRRITVSTAGYLPGLRKLAARSDLGVKLAVSLNACNDPLRSRLMPINRAYPLEALLNELRRFPIRPRERITFEYVLLKGLNDSNEDAAELARLLRAIPAKVNLIPFNPFDGCGFERADDERVRSFQAELLSRNVATSIRESRGQDASAACGQLGELGKLAP